MKKILILGISGSGKTTLAKFLGKETNLPVHHLDAYFWKPNWQLPDATEWDKKIQDLSHKECWIIDGNYSSSYQVLIPKADLIIVLEISPLTAIMRTLLRTHKHLGLQRDDVAQGCRDKFDWSFIHYIWDFKTKRLPLLNEALLTLGKEKKILRLSGKSKSLEEEVRNAL